MPPQTKAKPVVQAAPDTSAPPHSDEAELALLHALLHGAQIRGAQLESLESGHFYRAAHGWVYNAMLDLDSDGKAIDVVTLTDRLKDHDERDFLVIGGKMGPDAIQALYDLEPGGRLEVRSYAKTIRTKATRRLMIKQAEDLIRMAQDETIDPGVQLARHERAITKIRPFDLNQEFVRGKDSYTRHVELLEQQADMQVWHDVPFTALRQRVPVIMDGDVVVVLGPEGSGKSSLLAQWAQYEAEKGNQTVYVHTEMNDKAVFDRRAVNASRNIQFSKLQKPDELGEIDWIHVHGTQAATDHYSKKLDYWHAGIIPEQRLFTVMQHLVDTFGTRTFVIDYLNDVDIDRPKGVTDAICWRNFLARLEAFNNQNHTITITAAQENAEGGAYQIGRAIHQKAALYLKLEPEELTVEFPFSFDQVDYLYVPGNFSPVVKTVIRKYRHGGRGVFDLLFVGPRFLWADVPKGFPLARTENGGAR